MILGIFLSLGESLADLQNNGKLTRFTDYYLSSYLKAFDKIYIFSYGSDEGIKLAKNCYLVTNRWRIHRYLYTFVLVFLNWEIIRELSLLRVMQMPGVIPTLLIKAILGTRMVVTYGYFYEEVARLNNNYIAAIFYVLIRRLFLPFADYVIFSSETVRREMMPDSSKAIMIPNGIDLKVFHPFKVPKKYSFEILTQSRLVPEKNIDLIIRAISKIKNLKIHFTVIGNGHLKNNLIRLAKSLKVDLEIIENVPNIEMPNYMNRCDIFVLASSTEGSPKALIEAASCECCILASDISQNREVVDDGCAKLFCFNKKDLSGKLEELIINPRKRSYLGKNARKKIESKFDIEKTLLVEIAAMRSLIRQ